MNMGKIIIILGVILVIVGLVVHYGPNIPFFGKLPGDIHIKRDNMEFHFPIATSIVISILLSLILYLISKFR